MLKFLYMADRKIVAPDITALTPHDQKMAREPRSEWTLTTRAPIALVDMTAGVVPSRPELPGALDDVKKIWGTLAKAPLSVFLASRGDTQETIIVGPSLTAHDVNGLLYFAAPYKGFGFDTDDIIGDWKALYTQTYHANRKNAHALMPGWSQFEKSRERILGVLERNYKGGDFRLQNKSDVVVPVLRSTRDTVGDARIVLEPLDEGLQIALSQALPDQVGDPTKLDSGMGLMFLAAYSPDQTRWPTSDGYKHSSSSSTQTIGPTQVLAYAYREVAMRQADATRIPDDQDLQQSQLLDGLGRYAETGDMPTIDIVGDPIDSFFPPQPANPYTAAVTTTPSLGNQDTLVTIGGFTAIAKDKTTNESTNYNNKKEWPSQITESNSIPPQYEEITIVNFYIPTNKNNLKNKKFKNI